MRVGGWQRTVVDMPHSLHLSRIPLVRGMSRLDDGSAGHAEVEDERLLKIGL